MDALKKLKELKITPLLLPSKASLLISSLDNGFFGVFKRRLQQEMETVSNSLNSLHFKAAIRAYSSIISKSIVNFLRKCDLIGEQSLVSIKKTFKSSVKLQKRKKTRRL
ncbi:MAG: hypothetical protein NZM44_06940 [Candidatus Calescibacterium sp.]|nr:hypothetical protein [Candidatus Calescibacterium sp.]